MARQKSWFNLFLLLNVLSFATSQNLTRIRNNQNLAIKLPSVSSATLLTETKAASSSFTPPAAATLLTAASTNVETELPQTLPDFIRKMMKRFGEAKAEEALQSLDQLPLGLVMKILLVEMDKNLATDIVAMQRYAQSSDKTIITMIGRIVAGDKNVPKEIFAMDLKLMKFPWWMRIRERMLNNLERYIAAYSLVPVAAKTAVNGASKSVRVSESETQDDGLNSELAAAVAASATESSNKVAKQVAATAAQAPTTSAIGNANLESLKISLLNPIQQQQLLGTLALAQAAASSNAQAQNLLLQTQQATNINPFLLG